MISDITAWIMSTMQSHGSMTVFIGVIIESVIVPIPSPLIIMGAGAILIDPALGITSAAGPIFFKIVLPGAIASTLGAYFPYGITYWGGKPAIDRYARFLGFNWNDVLEMDKRMAGRVNLMVFLLRALPIIPLSLISGVAGVLRLPAFQFGIWTFLGSVISGLIVLSTMGLILWLRARMKRS
jgi:membrane protein DedA with SNARE-associated domain